MSFKHMVVRKLKLGRITQLECYSGETGSELKIINFTIEMETAWY